MNVIYWPQALQDEIRRVYFHVQEEGTVHRWKYTSTGKYDMGNIGTLTPDKKRFITVLSFKKIQFCLNMPRLAHFLVTGKQYRMVKTLDGNPMNLRSENLIALEPELMEDMSLVTEQLNASLTNQIEQKRLTKLTASMDRAVKYKEELDRMKRERRSSLLDIKPDEPAPQPIEESIRESQMWQASWKERHEYWQVRELLAGAEIKLLIANKYLNGLYTDISWEEAQQWARIVQENVGMSAEQYLQTKEMQGRDFSDIREMVESGQIGKLESDYYFFASIWFNMYKHNDPETAKARLRNYTWLDQEWKPSSEVEQYAQLKQKVHDKLADYYASQGVSNHEEMLAKIQKDCDEAETLFNRNKVKEEKDKLAGLAAKELPAQTA